MAIVYFGECDAEGNGIGTLTYTYSIDFVRKAAGYACPGAGVQNVKELGVECVTGTGSVRMGLYDLSLNLLAQTTTKSAVAGAWLTWSDAYITWVLGSALAGGTNYIIACAVKESFGFKGSTPGGGGGRYNWTDYTAGLPDPSPAGSSTNNIYNLRCGVEAAGGGGTLVAEQVTSEIHLDWTMPGD